MSIRAIVWAFDQECPSPSAKLVLIKLADHANDEGECWPSQSRVADDCGLTRETVNRQVKALVEAGLVEVQHRINGVGQLPNRYVLRCDGKSHPLYQEVTPPCDLRSHPPVTTDHTEPLREEPLREEPPLSPKGDNGFDEWWRVYPEKVGKGGAVKAWPRARKKATVADLVSGVRRYIESKPPDRAYCHPSKWLNEERWLDQPASVTFFDGSSHNEPSQPLTDEKRKEILRGINRG